MPYSKITFIGGGNMAQAMIGGLIADGHPNSEIRVADPSVEQRRLLQHRFDIDALEDNASAVRDAGILVLAVKPQLLKEVCEALTEVVQAGQPLVVSVAAGIRERDISRWLGGHLPVVRVMPNRPALVGCGAAGMYANSLTSQTQRELAENLIRAVGSTVWLEDESLLDPVTAVSGSGPAYFFLLMEVLEQVGRDMGLPGEAARKLTLETAFGAARMALQEDESLAVMRQQVTSPGGTTAAAMDILEKAGLRDILRQAVQAARDRSAAIADQFGNQ